MRYVIKTGPITYLGMPLFEGEILDTLTGQVVYRTTMMGEDYLVQNLNNKIRKLEHDHLKDQEAIRNSDNPKVHD